MKKIALLLLIIFTFTGCTETVEQENVQTEYQFICSDSEIFPFYCIGQDNNLWRIENSGAYSTGYRASYSIGSKEQSYAKYLKNEDMIIFATEIIVKSGITYANIFCQQERNAPELISNDVRLDSLRVQDDGNLLFIDANDVLFFRRDGITIQIESGVAQSEFVGEDTFLFRLKSGKNVNGEICYPIYSATADFRNYLMDGALIASADSENGKAYIIKNKHMVQKRAASVEVAECYVYADGEVLFEVPSVVLTQFEEDKHMFLISCNENEPTLKYDLYRVDGSAPVLKASNIISGKYISPERDVFAYEVQTAENVTTNIIDHTDEVRTYVLGENCSLDSLYACNPYTYLFVKGELLMLEKSGIGALIDDGIQNIKVMENSLVCFKEKVPPYSISVCSGTSIKNKAKEVVSSNVQFVNGQLYFYSGEGRDLNMADSYGGGIAFVSNVDTDIGYICLNGTVAVAKNDDKTLFIASSNGMCDGQLKIKKFITIN